MSAGHDQTKKRRLQVRMLNVICRNMSFYMMDSHKGKLLCVSNCLCLCYAYQKSTYQPRAIGDANCIQIIQSHICFRKRLLNYLVDLLYVFT